MGLKGRKVIAEVVEQGGCRYYRKGRQFLLGGFTPEGLCDGAYAVLSRDAQTMRCGGTLPWAKDGRVLTRCPDPNGATWQLRLEGESETPRCAQQEETGKGDPDPASSYQCDACRGNGK